MRGGNGYPDRRGVVITHFEWAVAAVVVEIFYDLVGWPRFHDSIFRNDVELQRL